MIPPLQREALQVLAEVYELNPEVRLGQLFARLGVLGEDHLGRNLWDIDDEQLLTILYHHRAELVARLSGAAPPVLPPLNAGPASTRPASPEASAQ